MLNDPSVLIEAEDVDPRVVLVPWPPLVALEERAVAVFESSLELDALVDLPNDAPADCFPAAQR
jgi:hypothetical protein